MAKIKDLNPYGKKFPYGQLHYQELLNLLMNAVHIKDVDYVNEVLIKQELFENGAVGYDSISDTWANVAGEGINTQGNPETLYFVYKNGKSFRRKASYEPSPTGAYKINALPVPYAIGDMIRETSDFIELCNNSIIQNINATKSPYIVVCKDKDLQLSIEHAIQQKQDGCPVIVVSEDIGEGLNAVNVQVPYIADKVEIIKEEWRDKLLNKLGIMSANTQKRERVQVGEVNATIGQCSDYIYLIIDTFNTQMETYGLKWRMELNGSLEELYTGDEYAEGNEENKYTEQEGSTEE